MAVLVSQAVLPGLRSPEGRQDLVRRYADALYRWAWVRTGGNGAEDIVQETFLRAFERPETYDPSRGEPWGWLLGIALNRLKSSRRGGRILSVVETPSAAEPHPMEAAEERERIRMALTSLPPDQQRLLQDHCLDGKPASSTAWDRLQAAKAAFRKASREMGVEA